MPLFCLYRQFTMFFAGEGAVRKSVPIRKAVLPTLYIAAELRNSPY